MAVFVVFVLSFIITSATANLTIKNEHNPRNEHVIDSATDIANSYFNFRTPTVVVSKEVDKVLVTKFIQSYRGLIILDHTIGGPPKQVVIIIESYYSLIRTLGKLKPDLKGKTLLHSGAHFLIVVLATPHRLQRINSILWDYYATNVVIVIMNKNNKIVLYTYYPYKNHLDCQNIEPALIGFWDDGAVLEKDLFPDKMSDMKGCPLYISTNKVYHPATEQKIPLEIIKRAIIRYLRDVMNFTPIISSRDYLSIDSDGAKNWSETLDDILTGSANISTCSISPGMDRVGILDYSIPYFRISIAWLGPPLPPGPIWWRLLSPLNGYLWLAILLVVIIVKSIPFIMKIGRVKQFCSQYFKNSNKLDGVVIRIWAVMMGQSIRVKPRRFRDLYILSLWIWFTFVVRSAYQSVLIGALKSDIAVVRFVDLQQAVDNGYSFGGRAGVLPHFEHDPFIRDGYEILQEEEFERVLQEVLEGKKTFIFAISLEYVWAYCMAQGINENECGHILPDSIMTVPLVIWMPKNSAFKRSLSVWLIRFLETGLLEKDTMKMSSTASVLKSTDPSALEIEQVVSSILCLAVGYLISIIVFIVEIILFKMKQSSIVKKSNNFLKHISK
uniref:Ionotropic receptor 7d4 n=1 Tax=Heliconius melpomene rosina TaxID=171916 RepID=A0A140G9G9_HELME|nr:ionotropic receptor 7d4 [Heliconius melpomene rosina]